MFNINIRKINFLKTLKIIILKLIFRLDERNEELLEEIETTNELSATVDTETIEEITSLNKQFLTQNSLVESLKNKINTIENDRIENQRLYEEKKELFNQNYKKTKFELISQAKVLSNLKIFRYFISLLFLSFILFFHYLLFIIFII